MSLRRREAMPEESFRLDLRAAPTFRPMSVVAKWLMDRDATWYRGSLGPGHIVLDGDLSPPEKVHSLPPELL